MNGDGNGNVDVDGFRLVQSKKKRKNIIGSKKGSTTILRSAVRTADLFISNCDVEVTADSLCEYILDEFKVKVQKCENLVTRYHDYKSFKVSLLVSDRIKLLNPQLWPEGIVCRKFYNPRTKQD